VDFYAETEKRKQRHLEQIGELTYRRYLASKAIEENERLLDELDTEIERHDAALREADQAERNFSTYLAIKEGALTTEQLAQAIRDGQETGERPDKEDLTNKEN
jgi:hypothetical protein